MARLCEPARPGRKTPSSGLSGWSKGNGSFGKAVFTILTSESLGGKLMPILLPSPTERVPGSERDFLPGPPF
jgi:hypothetical protein